jgi:hypothetical protein
MAHITSLAEAIAATVRDGKLCETAPVTVAVSEMFRYWLQGRLEAGFLGGAPELGMPRGLQVRAARACRDSVNWERNEYDA